MFLWLLFAFFVATLHGIQVDFERIEHLSGFDYFYSTLRVRKYNRTAITLNGTLQILKPLNRSFMMSTDIFHSSLGNQQFNHYPMKVPTQDVCDFVNFIHADYGYALELVDNVFPKDECPVVPRTMLILDRIFPTKISTDFFHSSLGNQQFNHYPAKLPTQHVCDFMENFYANYADAVADMINMPERDECPIKPRTIYVVNKLFPTHAIPTFFPPGLWKIFLINSLNSSPVVRFEIIIKVKNHLTS
uniref:Uncharacterized protein n=1 Tax=Anopheles farauti TaxID=69004 RepID=A0A182QRY6_9DIPT